MLSPIFKKIDFFRFFKQNYLIFFFTKYESFSYSAYNSIKIEFSRNQ